MKLDTPAAKILSEARMNCGHDLAYSFEDMQTVVNERSNEMTQQTLKTVSALKTAQAALEAAYYQKDYKNLRDGLLACDRAIEDLTGEKVVITA